MNKLCVDYPFELVESQRVSEKYDDYLYTPFVETADGFLKGRAVVTNTGIFPYLVDGKIENRLRTPEEVFKYESLESLKNVPLTDDHPPVALDSENIKTYQIGHLGSDIRVSQYYVSADIIITDADTIEKVKNGKVALSCGYFSDIEPISGRKWGGEYDSMQTNIRYNHVSIVDVGRAGDDARMHLDNAEQFICGLHAKDLKKPQDTQVDTKTDNKEAKMKIMLDNKEVDLSSDAAADIVLKIAKERDQLNSDKLDLQTQLNDAIGAKDTLKAQFDDVNTKLEAATSKYQALEDSIEARIAEEVKVRAEVLAVADRFKVQVDEGETVISIKKKIVLSQLDTKYHEETSAQMDTSDNYLKARYDSILQSTDHYEKTEQDNADKILPTPNVDSVEKELSLDEAKALSDKRAYRLETEE